MTTTFRAMTVFLLLAVTPAYAQQSSQGESLLDLTLQDLLNVEVVSVSRKAEELINTAAAVYVISREDIRRSGATTLPDVLRLAPGFNVAQLSANTWSVTSRGFGGVHANKLLVLIDGRSIYSPLNGGVNWEMQLLPLDAIEQVELIRGPGGSLWGANAINGVVNIITKTADRTEGGRFDSQISRAEPGNVSLAYGGKLGAASRYVLRGAFVRRGVVDPPKGLADGDDLRAFYGRARLDWGKGIDKFSLQADAAHGDVDQIRSTVQFMPPFRVLSPSAESFTETNTTFAWKRATSSRTDSNLQVFHSSSVRSQLHEQSNTIDIDARQHRAIGDRHDLVFGAEYRYIDSVVQPDRTISIAPADADWNLVTGFVQDEIALHSRLRVTAGAKVEHNQQTGVEIQPSARAVFNVTSRQVVWAAVSRAVRTPNRFERGMHVVASAAPGPAGLPVAVVLQGSPDAGAESLHEYEVGYRVYGQRVSVDVAGFRGTYTNLSSLSRGIPTPGVELGTPVLRIPVTAGNTGAAQSDGVEVAVTVKPAEWWNVSSNYSLMRMAFREGSEDSRNVPLNGPVPTHQFHVRSFLDLPRKIEAGALYYQASALPTIDVKAYKRLDLQLSWAPAQSMRITGGIRNLLHGATSEYADAVAYAVPSPVRITPFVDVRLWF